MRSNRIVNGYRMVYVEELDPHNTPRKNYDGYVYEHVLVAEKLLGRKLAKDEVVHHLDGNKVNNRPENLLVMLRSQHVRLHAWLNSVTITEKDSENPVNCRKPDGAMCIYCGKPLPPHHSKYCSRKCTDAHKLTIANQDKPVQDVVDKLRELGSLSACGKYYGVSANAIKHRLIRYNVDYKAICSQAREADKSSAKVQRLGGEHGNDKPPQAPDT
ncbi:MAG: HNH endonuclease [Bacteroidales bacterium]|nr:HNH endonuclease [Bacteroidales bacterium]